MADFVLAAFAPFLMQCPSFLANQRHLETGQGRSTCETLFGIRKIPGGGQIRSKLDRVEPAVFYLMCDDVLAELEAKRGTSADALSRSLST